MVFARQSLVSLGLLAASSVARPTLDGRQAAIDCKDPSHGLSPDCWKTLDLTNYVNDWVKKTQCGTKDFSRCFLDGVGLSTTDCSSIKPDACGPPNPSDFAKKPEDFYVAYNIYAINQAYSTYYTAVGDANTLASENVAAIIQLLNPPKTKNVLLQELLTALSVGLSFVAIEEPIVAAIVNGATQAAAVGKFLFPTGTADSQNAQLGSLDSALGDQVHQLMANINSAVPATLGDAPSFLSFAQSGQFSQNPKQSLFQDTEKLLSGLNTYVVSQAMQANNIVVARGLDTDVNALVAGAGDDGLNYAINGCGKGYDANGVCDAWWYDASTNISYSWVKLDDESHNYNSEMTTVFTKYTSPQLLIQNGAKCAAAGNSQKAGAILTSSPTGLDSDCVANMKFCTWNTNPDNFQNNEFTDCDNTKGWNDASCDADGGAKVPAGYLGPEMTASNGGYGSCR